MKRIINAIRKRIYKLNAFGKLCLQTERFSLPAGDHSNVATNIILSKFLSDMPKQTDKQLTHYSATLFVIIMRHDVMRKISTMFTIYLSNCYLFPCTHTSYKLRLARVLVIPSNHLIKGNPFLSHFGNLPLIRA